MDIMFERNNIFFVIRDSVNNVVYMYFYLDCLKEGARMKSECNNSHAAALTQFNSIGWELVNIFMALTILLSDNSEGMDLGGCGKFQKSLHIFILYMPCWDKLFKKKRVQKWG